MAKNRGSIPSLEIKYRNAAGRLLAVMRRAKLIPNSGINVREGWALVLDVDPADMPGIYQRTGQLYERFQEVEAYCQTTKPSDHFWFEHLPKVGAAICPMNWDSNFQEQRARVLPEVTFLLEQAASEMPSEAEIPTDALDGLRTSIEGVRESIWLSEIKGQLKRWLLEMLRMMREAIDRYELTGARGLRDTFYRLVGELRDVYEQYKDESVGQSENADSASERMREVGEVLKEVDRVTAIAARVPTIYGMLSNTGMRLLEWIGNSNP